MHQINQLYFADTPVQLLNCISIALEKMRCGPAERRDLIIYGQFNDADALSAFASSSGAFENVYVYQNVVSFSKWEQRLALIKVFFGGHCLKSIPDFVKTSSYDAMLFSCPTAVTYNLFSILTRNNPHTKVILYEDGSGTYTGSILQGLIYPGDLPNGVKNSYLVNVAKKTLRLLPIAYRPYPIIKLLVKCPELLQINYEFEIDTFKLDKFLLTDDRLAPEIIRNRLSAAGIIYLEPPENTDYFKHSLHIEHLLSNCATPFLVRRHPRTLSSHTPLPHAIDCTGGIWEVLCGELNCNSAVLVGFSSTSMLSPGVGFDIFPRIIVLDLLFESNLDMEQTHHFIDMLKGLYGKHKELINLPKTEDDLVDLLREFNLCAKSNCLTSGISNV